MGRQNPDIKMQKPVPMQKQHSDIMKQDSGMNMHRQHSDMMKSDTGMMKMEKQKSGMGKMGRQDSLEIENSGMGSGMSSGILAKPSFESSNEEVHMKVWLFPKREEWDDAINKDVADQGNLTEGTHHIMVEVTDPQSGQKISEAKVKISAKSPSSGSSETDLKPMMGQYGGNLKLSEKGDYKFNVNVENKGVSSQIPFTYTVK
jgi:hypothetical protein